MVNEPSLDIGGQLVVGGVDRTVWGQVEVSDGKLMSPSQLDDVNVIGPPYCQPFLAFSFCVPGSVASSTFRLMGVVRSGHGVGWLCILTGWDCTTATAQLSRNDVYSMFTEPKSITTAHSTSPPHVAGCVSLLHPCVCPH